MKGQRITLDKVAQRVGVTKMTVSRYLKTPGLVAKATGLKIQNAIEELGYVPTTTPVILSHAATRTLGLAVSSFSNMLFSDLIEGVESQAKNYGYDILIAHTSYLDEIEERKVAHFLSHQVDGLILCDRTHTSNTIKSLQHANIPVVELMSLLKKPIDMNIGYDHAKCTYAAVKGLINSGRKKLVYLRARLDPRTIDRQTGYEIACDEAGITPIVYGSQVRYNFTTCAELMHQVIQDHPDVDAVICTNDDVAIGAMLACTELKLNVPEKISVLGYNALNICSITIPKLTSIVTARKEMGRMAVDLIINRLRGDDLAEQKIELFPMLSMGDSLTSQEKLNVSRQFDTLFAKVGPLKSLKRPLTTASRG